MFFQLTFYLPKEKKIVASRQNYNNIRIMEQCQNISYIIVEDDKIVKKYNWQEHYQKRCNMIKQVDVQNRRKLILVTILKKRLGECENKIWNSGDKRKIPKKDMVGKQKKQEREDQVQLRKYQKMDQLFQAGWKDLVDILQLFQFKTNR